MIVSLKELIILFSTFYDKSCWEFYGLSYKLQQFVFGQRVSKLLKNFINNEKKVILEVFFPFLAITLKPLTAFKNVSDQSCNKFYS